ncbi:SDR family oxidoreductase [Novosphingobium sp. BL-8H]|uniref:SDR family NAD(P)-dependent oxidoreductase n=1 Tax=Novosphingobium sp. BL-8H TaxID=3127640 RepID=UPI003756CC06
MVAHAANDATRMDGKVVVVTGGAGGIGGATARLLASRGARIVVADIALAPAEQLAATLPDAIALHLDLEQEASIEAMIAQTLAHFGRLDVLHNNAALLGPDIARNDGDVEHMATALWDRTYAVNVRGTMIACRAALPRLRETRGNIVNTVSNLALQGHMIQAAYSSSKAAVIQMTRAIAASHGLHGVRCNAVAPGMTMTPALREAFPPVLRQAVEDETLRDRLGAPEDIAEAVAFLASDAARNITGQVLVADGGCASHVPGIAQFRAFFSGEH